MSAIPVELAAVSATAAKTALSVRVCRTWDELEQFRGHWNSLLRANSASSIFQTPEWLASWWQVYGLDKDLRALVFADSADAVVGIIPLYLDKTSFFGMSVMILRMVGAGSGDSDGLDFITTPGFASHCAKAFAAWLAGQKEWHVCALETLPQHSPVAECLSREAQESALAIDSTLTPNFIIDLPSTWPEYVSSLDSSFRPLLTRYPRRLQSRFTVKFSRCEDAADLKTHLQTLFDLHQMRWTGRGEAGAFAGNARRDFYYRMATAFLQRGWLEFWQLELNGETVGAQFCFRYNDTVSLLQEGFHPKYAAEKIGYALKSHLLQEMVRTGARRYDFLGGADAYKSKFGAHQENYLNLFIAGPSKLGRLYLQVQKQKRGIKAWLKRNLPAGVVAALRGHATVRATESSRQNFQPE
ncbi:MAG: GNAT family N-acetyltransferase [Candidatus Angelobacter sp.]|jgi:CelD/BcsL family acetyltransferase involved in cellulose biosynthesis